MPVPRAGMVFDWSGSRVDCAQKFRVLYHIGRGTQRDPWKLVLVPHPGPDSQKCVTLYLDSVQVCQ